MRKKTVWQKENIAPGVRTHTHARCIARFWIFDCWPCARAEWRVFPVPSCTARNWVFADNLMRVIIMQTFSRCPKVRRDKREWQAQTHLHMHRKRYTDTSMRENRSYSSTDDGSSAQKHTKIDKRRRRRRGRWRWQWRRTARDDCCRRFWFYFFNCLFLFWRQ